MRERDGRQRSESHGPDKGPPSSLRAIGELLRSLPERMRRPESLLMMLALFASIGVHMPPYLGLGALADYFEAQERAHQKAAAPPVEFDVTSDATPPTDAPNEPVAAADPPPPKPRKRPPPERERKKKPEPEKAEQAPAPEPEPKVVKVEPAPKVEPPEPPKAEERKQSVTQKSEDPDVEPPPDAKFLAEENRRVEEETVASVTSETKNDPDPQASAPQAEGPEKSGDSREDERGAEEGSRSDEQRQAAAPRQRSDATPRPPAPPQVAEPSPGRVGQAGPTPAPRAEATPDTVIRDPLGSFVLAPSNPDAAPPAAAQKGAVGTGQRNPLKVSWRAFEETFGAEQLAQDRMPREARRRGAGREKRWDEFRAAVENYIVGVKPGNTTALSAAADPFAAYLAAFHRNLHMEFAHDFLAGLPIAGDLGNPDLVTKVEIVVNADGTLDRVGVVKSSGNLMYDFGAFNAVQRGAPYPPTPEKIRSPDGRVYMRWALHRNESQCGTWNAEPFILKNAPRSPNDPRPDNVSPYRPGGGTEHGHDEPKRRPGKVPAVGAGETLGLLEPRARWLSRG